LSDDALPMQKMCADSTKKNTELTAWSDRWIACMFIGRTVGPS
jgi:hypothetical protein